MYVWKYQVNKRGKYCCYDKNMYYFTLHQVWNIDVHNAENSISGPLDFSRGSRIRRSYSITPLNKYSCQYEYPSKNLSYAPDHT